MAFNDKQGPNSKRKPGFRSPDKSTDYRYAKTNRYTTQKQDRYIPGERSATGEPGSKTPREFAPGDRPISRDDRSRKGSFGRPAKPFGRLAPQARPFNPASPLKPYGRPVLPPVAIAVPASMVQPLVTEEDNNLLFGRNPIREALKAGRDIEKILIAEGDLSGSAREIIAVARKSGINVQTVPKMQLDSITRNHQGMVAFASAYQYSTVDDILNEAREKNEKPFIVILDQVTDPHNLGAVIRSAAVTGVHGVIIPLHRAVGLTAVAVKTSSGAVEYVKVARVVNITRLIQDLKKMHIWVYAADMEGKDFRTVDFSGGTALVIGSEGEGISKLVKEQCDEVIGIPTTGKIASLNASVAAGILMYGVYGSRNK